MLSWVCNVDIGCVVVLSWVCNEGTAVKLGCVTRVGTGCVMRVLLQSWAM